jgi:hypothetical protein
MIDVAELVRIARAAEQMLAPLAIGKPEAIIRLLRPEPGDYERVFVGDAAERARVGYTALWNAPPRDLAKPGQTVVRALACDAESLRTDNEFSREFPGGYRRIAGYLQPSVVWLRFKFLAPGQSTGMAHDGLVRLDDRWAWFPKPWRILGGGEGN